MRKFGILLTALLLPLAAQKRPITHEDVWLMKRVGPPAVSPDGRLAVVSVTEPSYDDAKTASDLWAVPLDGSGGPRRLTHTLGAESGAVFSPDSKRIAFSARREGDEAPQIYLLPLDGGEAERVTMLSTGAASPQWRPDGRALLFQSRVYPGTRNDEENRKIAAERKARKYNTRVYEGFPFRFWDRWLDDLKPHVFVVELEGKREPRDLTAGTKLVDLPGFDGMRSTGDADLQAIWCPDGACIVFAASINRDVGAYAPTHNQLWRLPAQGGEPVALTQGPDSHAQPQFSPDGKVLYSLHTYGGEDRLYSLSRLARIDWPNAGQPRLLTSGWDRSISSFTIPSDSRSIFAVAEEHGHDKLFRIPADGGAVQPVVDIKEGVFRGPAAPARGPANLLVALWGSMVHPDDVALVDPEQRSYRLLTGFNDERISQIDWQPPRHVWFTSKAGARIHSLMVLPPAFDPAKKYPLLLFPHGGPHNMSNDQFFVRWNYHLLTSPGYVLLMTNYTGSTGFGEQFAAAIHKDVLRGPGSEIEQAADDAVARFSFIDGSRQAAAGASYGGYLMNWFAGNSKRFRCLINHAGLTDNASMWGSTDGAYYWERRMGSPVWELKGAWRDQSPAAYAGNFSTPMLITHGERDYRVPVSQAYEIYKLMQRRQVPSRLVIFPEENHWIAKGENAREHMREVLAWLKKYL